MKSKEATTFRRDIEGLRAFAVISVIIYHIDSSLLPGGYIGVDVFFVISGFLITGILYQEFSSNDRIDVLSFYLKRAKRLLPAATLVILSTLVAARWVYSPIELEALAKSGITAIFYVSNLWFAKQSTNYLAESHETDAFLHTWSLSVEEQFYLVWPFLIIITLKFSNSLNYRRNLLAIIGLTALFSFFLCIWLTEKSQPWAFFFSGARAWEFAVGAGVAIMIHRRQFQLKTMFAHLLALLGIALMLLPLWMFGEGTRFPGFAASMPVAGTAIIIFLGSNIRTKTTEFLSLPLLNWIGSRSYSLYLWHWPLIILYRQADSSANSLDWVWMSILSMLILSEITYRLVESPSRNLKIIKGTRRFAFGVVLVGMTASTATALTLREFSLKEMRSEHQISFLDASKSKPLVYDVNCHLGFFETDLADCTFGDSQSQSKVILIGDSHAAQWFPALQEISERKKWKLISLTKSACPVVDLEIFNDALSREYTECKTFRENVFAYIRSISPSIIFVSQSAHYLETGQAGQKSGRSPEQWENVSRETYKQLSSFSDRVVLLGDTPNPGFNIPNCASRATWHGKDLSECSFPIRNHKQTIVEGIDSKITEETSGLLSIDSSQLICPSEPCLPLERDINFLKYRDSHHLTVEYSRHLADDLSELLERDYD